MTTEQISLIRPDDWHLHLRDGEALQTTVPVTARTFARAIVMPNLSPPVTTVNAALAYRDRINAEIPEGVDFNPLMTLYLTDSLAISEIELAAETDGLHAIKYYPAGATTNSDNGVTAIENVYPVLEKMAELGVPLLLHGEVTDKDTDIFDREALFIENILHPLLRRIPELRIVLEHITTKDSVDFVLNENENVAATITAHHLLHNRNDMLAGGIRPHFYCLPILKRNTHQQALIEAATSGNPKFFLGTDSAPHAKTDKESACGCAGIYTAPAAIEFYAEVFDQENALDKLEGFASIYGPNFYDLPVNEDSITLQKQAWTMAESIDLGGSQVIPLRAGEPVHWRIKDS